MKTLNVGPQGGPAWHAARAWPRRCASEAAMALGLDKRTSRTDGLRMKASGDEKEFSAWAQENLLNRGHEVEKYGIDHAQRIIGDELFPETATDDSGQYLASFDGITMAATKAAEVKLWNETLVACVRRNELPDTHWPQLASQFIVGDELEEIVFVVTDGTPERTAHLTCRREDFTERMATVRAGWDQFTADVANYQHQEVTPAAVAAPVMALPALSIQVNGSISLIDNLAVFGEKLTEFIGNVNREPDTDEDFANLEAAVKTLQTAQDALEAAESSALAQTASIDEMRRTVAMYAKLARDNRLMFKKLVDAKKESLRAKIVGEGVTALREHIDGLNKRLGKSYMPTVSADFSGAAKGKRTITSLRSAVSDELARAKIAASAVADGIQVNLNTLRELAKDHAFLFADAAAIVLKAPDDFTMLVRSRIADHAEAERKKEEATRERIRAEEAAKLEAKQRAEAEALQRAEAQRQADAAKAAQVAPAPPLTPAIAPVAAQPAPIEQPAAWGLPPRTATVQSLPPRQRPSGAQLVEAVALHFKVSAATAADWLQNTDPAEYAGWPKSA